MSVRHDETLSTCCLCTPYCAACRNFANLKFRPAEYNSICWHDTQNLVSANILLWSASLSFSPSFFLSFSLSVSPLDSTLHFVVQCLNRLNNCSLSLTAQHRLQFLVRSSEEVFSFIRDGPSSNLDKCSQCLDCTVCCFPSAFPVLSQYLKTDHVCSLLNPFQFILLTALQSDDVYCDVRCWQCLYLPQTCRTTWQSDSFVFRSTYRNEGVSCC